MSTRKLSPKISELVNELWKKNVKNFCGKNVSIINQIYLFYIVGCIFLPIIKEISTKD